MINRLGREGLHKPYGLPAADSEKSNKNNKEVLAEQTHWGLSLEEVLDALPLTDGMTLSFHHHLRNGDYVLQTVMEAVHKQGVKDPPCRQLNFPHECLVPMLKTNGYVPYGLYVRTRGGCRQQRNAEIARLPHTAAVRVRSAGELRLMFPFIALRR